jgi:prepilin-type N-terminal cleavage/methylation domain-containing protein
MTRRRGFTLIELMAAIVVTSVVALLAYGTARTGIDTSERLDRRRSAIEAQMIVRSLLLDALRHPPEEGGASMNDMLFSIDDRTNGEGLPVDEVRFVSRGVIPPLGATSMWTVTLVPTDEGVRMVAVSNANGAAPIDALLPGARGLNARVLYRVEDLDWSDRWDAPGRVPAAIALDFLTEQGTAASPPLVVRAALVNER